MTANGAISFPRVWPRSLNVVKMVKKLITNIHLESAQLQDHPKDQGEVMVEFNLAEERKEA